MFSLCFLVLLGRLFVLQVIKHDDYLLKARANIESKTVLKAERGIIYDRNMVALAVNVTTYRIYMSPRDVSGSAEAQLIARGAAEILGVSEEKVLAWANDRSVRDRTLLKSASEEQRNAFISFVSENGLAHALHTEAQSKRYYPYGSLAASVIGFVGTDGGLCGIEAYYDAYLKGEDGVYITYKNASGQTLDSSFDSYVKGRDGCDVILTIDITLQALLEAQLKQTYLDSKAQNKVTGVVLDPQSGAVLAMATYPSFDLNDPYTLSEYYLQKLSDDGINEGDEGFSKAKNNYLYEMWNNKAVSTLYEPGSTFKIFTTSVALEKGVSNVNECFHCAGALKIDGYGTPIRCHKRTGHGTLDFAEALQKSCNPTMIRLAQRIGSSTFMSYFKSFGYTEKTGIDLPGEALGIYHSEEDFNNVELSVYSFGQTFKTTPLRQLCSVSAVANGGCRVTPFVVSEIREVSGQVRYSAVAEKGGRVLGEAVCRTVSDILVSGVDGDGGAKNAAVSGYRIAAKTGTSQKRDIKDENLYVGSCVAYSCYDENNVAVIIAVDEPMCANYYGSSVAAPYVAEFLKGALPYLGILPQNDADKSVAVGDYVGMSIRDAKKAIESLGLTVYTVGNGENVVCQVPYAFERIRKDGGRVILYTDGAAVTDKKVPNVVGMQANDAIRKLIDLGFNVSLGGATDYDRGVGATVIGQDIYDVEAKTGSVITLILRYLDGSE